MHYGQLVQKVGQSAVYVFLSHRHGDTGKTWGRWAGWLRDRSLARANDRVHQGVVSGSSVFTLGFTDNTVNSALYVQSKDKTSHLHHATNHTGSPMSRSHMYHVQFHALIDFQAPIPAVIVLAFESSETLL